MRKKTIMIEGDVVYRDRLARLENGTASEISQGCEQIITNSTTSYGSLAAPQACAYATVCPTQ